ncbi:MAG: T9SS type B sorting domain-containing protein [Polaribacter sp.]|nr:T9SS type B sorting domain-containing protein [Polaribacter sp.]
MKNKVFFIFFAIFSFLNNLHSQTKLFSDIPVNDFGTNNSLGEASTTKNVAVDLNGYIYVVYSSGSEVRIAKSIDGGNSFLPSTLVENTFFNVNPEININENGTIFIAWTLNTSIFFTLSTDQGKTFTPAKHLVHSIAGSININSYKNNVYITNQQAEKLLVNSNYGIGDFNIIDTGEIVENSEILIDKNGILYIPIDKTEISFFESTNNGKTLIKRTINPQREIFFSSYAISQGSQGTFIFVGGGNLNNSTNEVVSMKGYKINVKTGESETITLGKNSISPLGRILYTDREETVIDGYRSDNGYLMMNVSTNQGITFEEPITIAEGESHSITKSQINGNIIVAYEKNGKIFLSVYGTNNINITNNNNCSNFSNNLSLTNQSEIKSVVWNFDDPNSGVNNTSTNIDVNHQFTSAGVYNITAEVVHIDNTTYTITKQVEIFESPIINENVSLKQCDNSDINGFSFFNLNEVKEKIVTNTENYTISFFEEKTQAENNENPIVNITNYENQTVSTDTIWARVENTNGCYEISEVNLLVSTTQIPLNFSKSFYQCDDGANISDGIATFDFSSVTNDIINIFPVNQQLDINYYRNEADALSEENAISNISNYQNIGYPNQQTIYVRVDSKVDNSCLGLGAHISLFVEKVPVAIPVSINPECDNDRDGFFAFDTTSIQNTIIGSQTNVSVRYFDENGVELSSPLPNPFITKSQKITARIENTTSNDLDGKCFDETILDFIVNTVPIANPIAPQTACDDDFDGIVAFNTSNIQSTIIGNQTGLIIKYFDENNNPLSSPLPNPFVTASQSIRVRIENPSYDVCYEETTIDFTVYEKPFVDIISEDIICITNNAQLELKVENPTPNYTYTWKDENDAIIGNSASVYVSKGGIYKVFATSAFGCNSDEEEILIKESSISSININDIEVQDDSENNFIKINTTNLGLGNYEFRLLDANFNVLFDYQDEPLFDNLDGGVYNLEINDKNACGAIPFEIALISFPTFFTPNGDGVNDFWQIKGIDKSYYKSGIISIFNRFGKQISSFSINDIGWDGTYNGSQMIANDYWFRVVLIKQNDEVKTRTGNFSLIRK